MFAHMPTRPIYWPANSVNETDREIVAQAARTAGNAAQSSRVYGSELWRSVGALWASVEERTNRAETRVELAAVCVVFLAHIREQRQRTQAEVRDFHRLGMKVQAVLDGLERPC